MKGIFKWLRKLKINLFIQDIKNKKLFLIDLKIFLNLVNKIKIKPLLF